MFSVLARALPRRTLFTTPLLSAPKEKAKRATTAKKPKEEPKPKRVPKELQPPKRGPSPYLLFYASFLKSQQPKPQTVGEVQQLSKRAGGIWKGYSMAEKQPFYDESEARKAQANQERDAFFRKLSQADLKRLNAIRKTQGKHKIHPTIKVPVALSPFIAFSMAFRDSSEGQTAISDTNLETNYTVRAAVAAGRRWRSMSKEEKAPYFEAFEKEKELLKANVQS